MTSGALLWSNPNGAARRGWSTAALVRPVVHAVEASPPFEANIGEVADAGGVRVDFEKYVPDRQAHEIWVLRWYRIVPYRSYVKGWKISPSYYINQDLATVWLDK